MTRQLFLRKLYGFSAAGFLVIGILALGRGAILWFYLCLLVCAGFAALAGRYQTATELQQGEDLDLLGLRDYKKKWFGYVALCAWLAAFFGALVVGEYASCRYPFFYNRDDRVAVWGLIVALLAGSIIGRRAAAKYKAPGRRLLEFTGVVVLSILFVEGFFVGGLMWWNGAMDRAAPRIIRADVINKVKKSPYRDGRGPLKNYVTVASLDFDSGTRTLTARSPYLMFDPGEEQLFEYIQVGDYLDIIVGNGALRMPWWRELKRVD